MASSRGNAISGYSAPFSKGALIYGANIQSGVVTSAHIADGTIVAADLKAGSVTSAKLATNAVANAKINAAAVTSAKLGVSAVQNTNIAANAIRAGAISALAVTNAKLAANAVTSAKMNAEFLSGSLVSGGVVFSAAHSLGAVPKHIQVNAQPTLAQATSATRVEVYLANASSAATSTLFYLIGTQPSNGAVEYVAYLQL